MRELKSTTQFRKDYKRLVKRGYDMNKLAEVIDKLLLDEPLDARHRDHGLAGRYLGYRECHIEPDWLLIYTKSGDQMILVTVRTGSHSDLFNI